MTRPAWWRRALRQLAEVGRPKPRRTRPMIMHAEYRRDRRRWWPRQSGPWDDPNVDRLDSFDDE